MSLKKIKNFLNTQPLGVLSTFNEQQKTPQSALVAFVENDHLELFFTAFAESRKYFNLQYHTKISFVIGFDYLTVQYEGIASELHGDAIEDALSAFSSKKTPNTSDYLTNSKIRFFKAIPSWIKYSDYTIYPADIFIFNLKTYE